MVDQIDPDTKAFDEHKVIAAVHSEFEARVLYQKAFSDGRGAERIGAITPMSIDVFKRWLKTEDTTEPVAYAAPMAKGFNPNEPRDSHGRWSSRRMLANAGISKTSRNLITPNVVIDYRVGKGVIGGITEKASRGYDGISRGIKDEATKEKYKNSHKYNSSDKFHGNIEAKIKLGNIRQGAQSRYDMHLISNDPALMRHEQGHAIDIALSGGRANAAKIIGSTFPAGKNYMQATGRLSNNPDFRRAWKKDVEIHLDSSNVTFDENWTKNPSEAVADIISARTGPSIPKTIVDDTVLGVRRDTPYSTRVLRRLLSRHGIMLKSEGGEESISGGFDVPFRGCFGGVQKNDESFGPFGRSGEVDLFKRCVGKSKEDINESGNAQNIKGGQAAEKIHSEQPNHVLRQLSKNFIDFQSALTKSDPAKKPTVLEIADQHVDTLAERIAKALGWLADQGDVVAAAAADGPQAAAQAVPMADFGSKMDDAF
ncbi:hypothetical protein CCP3SC15_5100001 [Gammaproteobacteria bacterium]